MDFSKIQKTEWEKNWAGTWSILFASFYGRNYTEGLRDLVGEGFSNNLIVFDTKSISNYLPKAELKRLCTKFSDGITNDGKAEEWSKLVFERTDRVMSFIQEIEGKTNFSKDDYERLKQEFFDHVPPNFAIKKVIDYLPAEVAERNLELFSKLRVYTEPVYGAIDMVLKRMAASLMPHLKPEHIHVLLRHELEACFQTGKMVDVKVLEERARGAALLYDEKGNGTTLVGEDLKKLISILAGSKSKQIKGTVAYKGYAKGRARIVHDPKECNDFQDGEILVTGMTRPEYLQLMQKSAAFITDAGGLLSHAAIVARELKKPCVIGTQIATKTIQEGDMVEVDANKGTVTIL
jgi:phosphohistidine swiveling domain-containing protein